MRVEIIYPTDERVLSTSTFQNVRFDAGSVRLHKGKTAKIQLVYAKHSDLVIGSQRENPVPNTIVGNDYDNGVNIDSEGIALFKIKPNCLSSQHDHQEFRFKVSVGENSVCSDPFKTVTKLNRKRNRDDDTPKLGIDIISETTLSEVADAMDGLVDPFMNPQIERMESVLTSIEAKQATLDAQQKLLDAQQKSLEIQQKAFLEAQEFMKASQAQLQEMLNKVQTFEHTLKKDAEQAIRLLQAASDFPLLLTE